VVLPIEISYRKSGDNRAVLAAVGEWDVIDILQSDAKLVGKGSGRILEQQRLVLFADVVVLWNNPQYHFIKVDLLDLVFLEFVKLLDVDVPQKVRYRQGNRST
jgi:hypothetical protein